MQHGEIIHIQEVLCGIEFDARSQGFNDLVPGADLCLIRAHLWMIPDAQPAQLGFVADPDGGMPQ